MGICLIIDSNRAQRQYEVQSVVSGHTCVGWVVVTYKIIM